MVTPLKYVLGYELRTVKMKNKNGKDIEKKGRKVAVTLKMKNDGFKM